jgi:hypothetical protein
MYDPKIGRWLSQDPLGFAAGDANLYRYVVNGATNEVDPSGLDGLPGWLRGGIKAYFDFNNPINLLPPVQINNFTDAVIADFHGYHERSGSVGGSIGGAIFRNTPGWSTTNDIVDMIAGRSSHGSGYGRQLDPYDYGSGIVNSGEVVGSTIVVAYFGSLPEPAPAPGQVRPNPGNPFPNSARPGQILENIDPKSLQAGRRDLVQGPLALQQDLIARGIPRSTPIEVTPGGVIWDGNHGAAAAALAGKPITVLVVPRSLAPKGPVTGLPIRPGDR